MEGRQKEIADIYLKVLEMRFRNKIEAEDYYLSYSGGKDSHLLLWFIKEYLGDTKIPVIGVNTRLEHAEIRKRMEAHCDRILLPALKLTEIKEQYGIPCFTKNQDEFIDRYQRGSRAESTMRRLYGTDGSMYALNKTARELTINGQLHRVSNKCCKYTKKIPLQIYEKETERKPILAVRRAESINRRGAYQNCMSVKGRFTPLFDFTNQIMESIYATYPIAIPKIYEQVERTGCMGRST